MATEEQRYWSKVAKGDGCWEWSGARRGRGYGMFWTGGRLVSAHRLSWEQAHGRAVPAGMKVMHTCDNPPCVRPDHLVIGTQTANVRDMDAKGRRYSRLTPAEVAVIKRLCGERIPKRAIAEQFGVSESAIWDIAKGRHWKDIQAA